MQTVTEHIVSLAGQCDSHHGGILSWPSWVLCNPIGPHDAANHQVSKSFGPPTSLYLKVYRCVDRGNAAAGVEMGVETMRAIIPHV